MCTCQIDHRTSACAASLTQRCATDRRTASTLSGSCSCQRVSQSHPLRLFYAFLRFKRCWMQTSLHWPRRGIWRRVLKTLVPASLIIALSSHARSCRLLLSLMCQVQSFRVFYEALDTSSGALQNLHEWRAATVASKGIKLIKAAACCKFWGVLHVHASSAILVDCLRSSLSERSWRWEWTCQCWNLLWSVVKTLEPYAEISTKHTKRHRANRAHSVQLGWVD